MSYLSAVLGDESIFVRYLAHRGYKEDPDGESISAEIRHLAATQQDNVPPQIKRQLWDFMFLMVRLRFEPSVARYRDGELLPISDSTMERLVCESFPLLAAWGWDEDEIDVQIRGIADNPQRFGELGRWAERMLESANSKAKSRGGLRLARALVDVLKEASPSG